MNNIVLEAHAISDIGTVREINQDIFKIFSDHKLFSIADGMGGHKAGDVAAKETLEHLSYLLMKSFVKTQMNDEEVIYHLKIAIQEANFRVYNLNKKFEHLSGMGTTLCVMHFNEKSAIFAHVGDSRIYHIRKNELNQLTLDHSLINKLKAKNINNFNEKTVKNIITKAIGTHPTVEPSIGTVLYEKEDLFLMCTDGLSDYVANDQILNILKNHTIDLACQKLIDQAKINGSHDNITALIVKITSK
ncbi:MAG: hypothetical protein A3F40_01905 [Chlamydiae bacterium RIFCSPHIGHO2_12_FULL_27_8]|nr:MAG: hypothetical protein A3F40_01905 [Chlamydiae bacterium RIFCSPHIGHO2_12_FULL_27_8]OGN65565.1 MAG: hypothetical protein A2888_02545 [Chlamydiae bacterium RIFCSPLOWO2_01_FULL_28_7]